MDSTTDRIREAAAKADQRRAVIATDLAGTIVYWNETAAKIYGWSANEAIGRDVVEVTPTMMSRNEADGIMNALQSGGRWQGAFMVRDRSGHPMIVEVEDVAIEHDGKIIGIVGMSRPKAAT
ncbi:MAG TPA: PAS domain-containing protein [Gemmatimonadaceae bacterium]|nr:PAS domain-containing protein [Gemmatimonadaceae bacterium]